MAALRPEFGPSLPEVLAPRIGQPPKRVRNVLLGVFTLLVLIQAARIVHAHETKGLSHRIVVRSAIPFNLGYRTGLERVTPPPAGVALELRTRPADPNPQRFSVVTEPFDAGTADPSADLALRAAFEIRALRRDYPTGFRPRGDGRTRITALPAYQILFQTRIGNRTVYGKRYLIVPDDPKPAQIAVVTLLSTRSTAIPAVSAVGSVGLLKPALFSFRFGTQRP